MGNKERMDDARYIFGTLLLLANKMETILDRELKEFDVTSKQWLLSAVIAHLFKEPPTIKEVSSEMGSSHQNIKQIALKLEQKGLLMLEKDNKDARATRIKLSKNSHDFWVKTQKKGMEFIEALFNDIDQKDLTTTKEVLNKLVSNISHMNSTED